MGNEPLGPVNLLLLVPPAAALIVAMRILFGRSRRAAPEPMQVLMSVSSVTMLVMVVLGLLLGTIGPFLIFIPLPLICIVLGLMVWDRTRRSEHRGLIWALASAAGRGIPLPEAARAFADETPSRTGARSLRLAESLERGQPLSTATRSARLRMGTPVRMTVRLAESLGLLGPAMKQQIEESQQIDAALREAIGRFFYLATVVIVMQGVLTFTMLKIVPVFQKMFEEFGLKLPALTNLVINLSNWFVLRGWFLLVPFSAIFLPCFFIAATLYYVGWFPRGWPIWWWLFRRYDGAVVMRGLALAVRRGLPMPEALKLVEESYPLPIVSRRLAHVRQGVERGQAWQQCLVQERLISRGDAAVLGAAERVGNLDWALDEMAASGLRRQAHRVQIALQILFPVLLMSVGLVVFIIVCGLFMPLISLIQGLS